MCREIETWDLGAVAKTSNTFSVPKAVSMRSAGFPKVCLSYPGSHRWAGSGSLGVESCPLGEGEERGSE